MSLGCQCITWHLQKKKFLPWRRLQPTTTRLWSFDRAKTWRSVVGDHHNHHGDHHFLKQCITLFDSCLTVIIIVIMLIYSPEVFIRAPGFSGIKLQKEILQTEHIKLLYHLKSQLTGGTLLSSYLLQDCRSTSLTCTCTHKFLIYLSTMGLQDYGRATFISLTLWN